VKFLFLTGFLAGFYFLSVCAGGSGEPREITVEQVDHHLGEKIIVRGTVTEVARSNGEVFICFGRRYPNQAFKGFIAAGSAIGKDKSLNFLAGKKVGLFGKIATYNGKPEIEISSLTQILRY
jgi:hypothetical protein